MTRLNLKINGMHCVSCKTLIEASLSSLSGVFLVKIDYPSGQTLMRIDEGKIGLDKIIAEIEKLGHKADFLEMSNKLENSDNHNFEIKIIKYIAAFIGLIILVGGYFLLQKAGAFQIFSRLEDNNISYGLLFILGLLASFHCVGMCGGLIVTYSVECSEREPGLVQTESQKVWPHILYNFGRLVSYTIIGAILGGVGSFFGVNPYFSGFLTIFVGIFMLAMGISFIKKINFIEKIKSMAPSFIAKYLFAQRSTNKPKGPLIVGFLNGLMPCGPLQAVQFYALGTGSITKGALSMFSYALGTVFLMLGFGYFVSHISNQKVKKMMIISGIVVLILGLFMLNRGLTNFGLGIKSLSNTNDIITERDNTNTSGTQDAQIIKMDLTYRGYVPNVFSVKRGVPVRWIINVKQMSGCTNAILLEKFNIKKDLKYGENIIEFTPTEIGEIPFSCWMKMVWGKFIVTE
jgi:sulfite exporter TauE/SafE/copper chaperone CopZ